MSLLLIGCLLVDSVPASAGFSFPAQTPREETQFQEQALAVGALWVLSAFPWEKMTAVHARQSVVLPAAAVAIPSALYQGIRAAIRAWKDPSRRDRYVQRRLKRAGLFHAPKHIDGQDIFMSLFGFEDKPWKKYLEIVDVILQGEQNLDRAGLLSPEEAQRLKDILVAREVYRGKYDGNPQRRKDDRVNEYVHFVQHIRQVLLRNPFAIISSDPSGRVVGVVFCSFGYANAAADLPPTMIRQTHWHLRHQLKSRNAMVDFWFTGETGAIAEATLLSSMELAEQIRWLKIPGFTVEDDHIFAYSNLRTLWKWPDLTPEELIEKIKRKEAKDPAISGHIRRGGEPMLVKHNAFPSIFHIPGTGIGRRAAVIIRYLFRPGPKPVTKSAQRRRFKRATQATAYLLSAA